MFNGKALTRVVIDTNLIIAARYKPKSASSKVIGLCLDQKLLAVYSGRTKDENLFILNKVRPPAEYLNKIIRFYAKAMYIPKPTTRITNKAKTTVSFPFKDIIVSHGFYGVWARCRPLGVSHLSRRPRSQSNIKESAAAGAAPARIR